MAAGYFTGGSKRALIALAFPLAALVPLALPFDLLPGADGQAAAATVKKAERKVVVKKPVTTKKVCTTTKVKGRKVTKCTTVKLMPAAPVLVTPVAAMAPPIMVPEPAPGPPLQMAPIASQYAPQQYAPPPVSSAVAYYWIDQADSLAQAFGNSPPDFTFDFDGIDCWAWLSRDGEALIVEPGRDGVRQYFYAPRQTSPYLVRDSYSSFAFDGRELVQLYDGQGRLYTGLTSQARYDGETLQQRGRALYAASLRQRRWDRGSATAWIGGFSSLGYYDGWNSGWNGAWRENPDWDRWDRDHRRQRPPRHLGDEHRDRTDARSRYDQWHRRGDQGAPPPTGNPVVTPTDNGGERLPPVRPPRVPPRPQPQQPDQPLPQAAPAAPVAEPSPPAAEAPTPRRERPRREIEPESGAPPVPMIRTAPQPYEQPEQPTPRIEAAPVPVPVPVPAPEPVYAPPPPAPEPAMVAPPVQEPVAVPMPAPVPTPVPVAVPTPVPVIVPAPAQAVDPAPAVVPEPPSPPPPSERTTNDTPIGTDQP